MRRGNQSVAPVLFSALLIIGCSASVLMRSQRRREQRRRTLEEAMQNWEGEGGAISYEPEEELV